MYLCIKLLKENKKEMFIVALLCLFVFFLFCPEMEN